jgi:hypothetical protein
MAKEQVPSLVVALELVAVTFQVSFSLISLLFCFPGCYLLALLRRFCQLDSIELVLKSVFKRRANYLFLFMINFQMRLLQRAGFQTLCLVQAKD